MSRRNPIKDSIFPRFGKLIVISPAEPEYRKSGRIEHTSLCLCDCGSLKVRRNAQIIRGQYKECSCHHEFHGLSKNPIYAVWNTMRERCYNLKHKSYPDYGGSGITVCSSWKNSFYQFYLDMGDRPSNKHSIDRIDGAKGYYHKNCRWATLKQQARNTKKNRYLEYRGARLCYSEWAEITGLSPSLIIYRLKAGWSAERIITTPADKRFGPKRV